MVRPDGTRTGFEATPVIDRRSHRSGRLSFLTTLENGYGAAGFGLTGGCCGTTGGAWGLRCSVRYSSISLRTSAYGLSITLLVLSRQPLTSSPTMRNSPY